MNNPLVSIILPVFNGEKYLEESINSLLLQTYQNIQIIIIDDGSYDSSSSIIKAFSDPRIEIFTQKNKGLSLTLNYGISLAKGSLIARHDSDDIALPTRIEKQVDFLLRNPQISIVGTRANIYLENNSSDRSHSHPIQDYQISYFLYFNNPIVHSSVMLRKECFQRFKYDHFSKVAPPEDYELWTRMDEKFRFANLPEILQIYRETESSISRLHYSKVIDNANKISIQHIRNSTLSFFSEAAITEYVNLMNYRFNEVKRFSSIFKSPLIQFFLNLALIKKYGLKRLEIHLYLAKKTTTSFKIIWRYLKFIVKNRLRLN